MSVPDWTLNKVTETAVQSMPLDVFKGGKGISAPVWTLNRVTETTVTSLP